METSVSVASIARKIAVLGSGISGALCASTIAKTGISVTVFDSARGPGGRMSQRRETTGDGKELLFDHGAPFFSVSNCSEAFRLVCEWESRGLIAEWKEKFGSFDCITKTFTETEQEGSNKRYVGVPGMNSICRALCHQPGVESKFGVGVGRVDWLEEENTWRLTSSDGQNLGHFAGVVASDKNIVSSRFTSVTGRPPPLDLNLAPDLRNKVQDISVSPCFAVMLAFPQPLSWIPFKGFTVRNSKVLNWVHCDSSKPGRPTTSERWVLHSTAEYAETVIAKTGLKKPSDAVLTKVAEELLEELQNMGLNVPQPLFKKAHRWGSAFPLTSVDAEEKCLWDKKRRLAICGDFCVSPDVEGAIVSGMAAGSKLTEMFSCL
ncbi:renalase [Rhodamnia argentea]|uniref:Renalase n=1 Tax=Rhodamnia argentea TaxID=178133 RepID=A0A8B8NS81_9MYRT|nr:renalase [Rhodamnia argentea]